MNKEDRFIYDYDGIYCKKNQFYDRLVGKVLSIEQLLWKINHYERDCEYYKNYITILEEQIEEL